MCNLAWPAHRTRVSRWRILCQVIRRITLRVAQMNTTDHTYNFAAWCTGAAVLVQRGSCPFATKAENAERAKAAAVLVINSEDGMLVLNAQTPKSLCRAVAMRLAASPDCMYMDLNNTEAEAITMLPVVSVSKQTGLELKEAAQQNDTIALWTPYYSSFDFNVILLWVMAIGTFVLAGIWAGNDSFGTEHSYLQAQDDSEVVTQMNFQAKHIRIA